MAKFFKPYPNENTWDKYDRVNSPVNLDRIVTFFKVQNKIYPDNDGVPAIQLMLDNQNWIMWRYKLAEDRDIDYERLEIAE